MKMKEKPKRPKQLVNQNEDNDAIKVESFKKRRSYSCRRNKVRRYTCVEQELKKKSKLQY